MKKIDKNKNAIKLDISNNNKKKKIKINWYTAIYISKLAKNHLQKLFYLYF